VQTEANVKTKKRNQEVDGRALVTDVDAACAMLDKSKDGVYALLHSGELESYLDGRSRRITIASIKNYISRKIATTTTFTRARYPNAARAPDT
jgi:excisionase family DNA binding protein